MVDETRESHPLLRDATLQQLHWRAPKGSSDRDRYAEATDLHDLLYNDPETLWLLILEIHHRDHSIVIQQVLSAGPVEDLLAKHGAAFIDRLEIKARQDPHFAKLLGEVWMNRMSEAVWGKIQVAWNRRGWDGIPE